MFRALTLAAALAAPGLAAADISVRFTESAPKDRFTITNEAACETGPVTVEIDLASAAGGLIFDVSGEGAGVKVFQPFELVAGQERVSGVAEVLDGDQRIALELTNLPAGGAVAFTIDVDDTLKESANGQIMVSSNEMEGAVVAVVADGAEARGVFGARPMATVGWSGCSS